MYQKNKGENGKRGKEKGEIEKSMRKSWVRR